MENIETKVCSKCGNTHPIIHYQRRKNGNKIYTCSICKDCERDNRRKYAAKHREKYREISRKNGRNKKMIMFYSARGRAKEQGLAFDITPDDIVIPEVCPVLGIPIVIDSNKQACDGSPTLDKIDNTKGYVKGNIMVISYRANSIKRDATYSELMLVAEYVKKNSIDIDDCSI